MKLSNSSAVRNWPVLICCFIIILFGIHLRSVSLQGIVLEDPLHSDALDYAVYAHNIQTFGIYSRELTSDKHPTPTPDALRAPLFPLFASAFDTTKPNFVKNVLFTQTVIQIISFTLLTLMIIKNTPFLISITSSLLIWTYPHFIGMNSFFLTESLFISEIALFISIFLKKEIGPTDWIAAGFLIGLSAITRPTLEHFCIFFLICSVHFKSFKRDHLFFVAAMLTPIIIWKVRNWIHIGSLSDPTLMANGLYHGSFPNFLFNNRPETLGYAYRFDPEAWRTQANVIGAIQLIWERFSESPKEYLTWYLFGKHQFLWQWDIFEGFGDIYIYIVTATPWDTNTELFVTHNLQRIFHIVWVPCTVVYAWYLFLSKRAATSSYIHICCLLIIYASLLHLLLAPYNRYGIPFKLPLMIIFSYGLYQFMKTIQHFYLSRLVNGVKGIDK